MMNDSSQNTLEVLASRGDVSIDRKRHPPIHLLEVEIPRPFTTPRNRERLHTAVAVFLVRAAASLHA